MIKRRKATPESPMKNLITDKATADGFTNVLAKLGLGQDNLLAQSHYSASSFISRNRQELDMAYRGSWLVGQAVDTVAEDMTRDGVTFHSEMKPGDISQLQVAMSKHAVWHSIANTIKWARLYGGCIAVILTDGANYEKPLKINAVGKDTFRGLLVLDRWMVQPSMGDLITTISKDMGMPKYYQVMGSIGTLGAMKIHHTRVMRFDGIELPYYQKLFENLWGLSVVERMLDRLLAFDSASTGAAQLLFKAHLRIISVEGFREALSIGGASEAAVIKQFQYIRQMQNNEGVTILDAKDKFEAVTNSFSGIADLIATFATQVSGALNIPIIRLFGQSPAGFNTGEGDLRNYYDHISKLQENQLRPQLDVLFNVIAMSELGEPLPKDFEFEFNPLWTLSYLEKSQIATANSGAISGMFSQGIISKPVALKELLQQSRVTGMFTNITDEDIEKAKLEPPEPTGAESENPMNQGEGLPEAPQVGGMPVVGEVPKDAPQEGASSVETPQVAEAQKPAQEKEQVEEPKKPEENK